MKHTIQPEDVGKDINDIIKGLKNPKFDAKDMVMHDNIAVAAWMEWCDFRKEKKKPISKMAANKALNLLAKYSLIDQCAIINKSIQNDYQGLFDLKVVNQPVMTLNDQLNDRSWAVGMDIED